MKIEKSDEVVREFSKVYKKEIWPKAVKNCKEEVTAVIDKIVS